MHAASSFADLENVQFRHDADEYTTDFDKAMNVIKEYENLNNVQSFCNDS